MDNDILYPGDTLGIIGNSTNGVALVTAARNAGINVGVYGADENNETMELADFRVIGNPNERLKLIEFAERCDAVTYESETVDSMVIELLSEHTRIPQGSETLEIMQDRSLERAFFAEMNLNVAPAATIVSLDDVYQSIGSIGYPSILKPIQKGLAHTRQLAIKTQSDIAKAADILDWGTYLLESQIPYQKELSVVVAKNQDEVKFFPIVENQYQGHQLKATLIPADINADVAQEILRITQEISDHLNYTGVFEVAFYLTTEGNLYVKRVVPAMHESGYVFERATNISMAEEHLRAIAGLPLTDINITHPLVMFTFTTDQIQAVRTQWQLKQNWFFYFFHRTQLQGSGQAGYVLVEAESVKEALDQIEDTGLWNHTEASEDK